MVLMGGAFSGPLLLLRFSVIALSAIVPDITIHVNYNCYMSLINDICNLYLHHDITGKDCHKWFVDNPDEWEIFKNLVDGGLKC